VRSVAPQYAYDCQAQLVPAAPKFTAVEGTNGEDPPYQVELARPSGGAFDTVTVLRVFLVAVII
jgi:hypothetical protein